MKTRSCISGIKHFIARILIILCGMVMVSDSWAQQPGVAVSDNKVTITIKRAAPLQETTEMLKAFNLTKLPLAQWIAGRQLEQTSQYGWTLQRFDSKWLILSRTVDELSDFKEAEEKMLAAGLHYSGDDLFPENFRSPAFAYNKLRQSWAVSIHKKVVTLLVEGFDNAREVKFASGFTGWQQNALAMQKENGKWKLTLELEPGKYPYKLLADGSWHLHPQNAQKENDGRGNINSVLVVPNHVFRLAGYATAKEVFVAGSFSRWENGKAAMVKNREGVWELSVYLPNGTHTYRFIADGKWMEDPAAQGREPNEFGEFNSLLKVGRPVLFRLDGFDNARDVRLVGSFNGWNKEGWKMTRKNEGWELLYTPAEGNHAYYFVADGSIVGRRPVEGLEKADEPLHFSYISSPNYTFYLKGYQQAKTVYLSGSFNGWSKTAYPMVRENGRWALKMHVPAGKHTYKFIVDGAWIIDPANELWEQNGHSSRNSVLWME